MALERVVKQEQSKILSKVDGTKKKKRDETDFLKEAFDLAPSITWEELPEVQVPKLVVEISGTEGSGKTHAACTFPKPAMLDTEGKGWVIMKKFGHTKWAKASNFEDVISFVKAVINDPEIETAIFDSSKDIVDMAERYALEQLGKETLFSQTGGQVLYTHVYQKMDWIITSLRRAGKNVVFTSRMKEEYKNNSRTGRMIRDGYKKSPYQVDILIELRSEIEWNGDIQPLMTDVARVTKNGFVKKSEKKPYIRDACYDTIIAEIFDTVPDQAAYIEEFKKSL